MALKAELGRTAHSETKKEAAKERLAKALRANLRRRKAQERDRRAGTPEKMPD